MKRYAVVFAILIASLLAARMVFAQDGSDLITLNDATPGIDVVITPVSGTTGALALELYQTSVTVVDTAGTVVFQMADPRVHRLELRFAPGASSYTLTAERLPGTPESYLRIMPQLDLTQAGDTVLVTNSQQPLGFQQSVDLPLTANTPSQVANFDIPADGSGTMMVSFPNAPVMAQITDEAGQAVATLRGSGIDALGLVLDGGSYELTLLNTNPAQETLANMEVTPALPSVLDEMLPAVMAAQPSSEGQTTTASAELCAITIDVASVNLRSGPGTGYSVLDYGFRNEQFQVGGVNPGGAWVVVANPDGSSAWVSRDTGTLSGSCQGLAVYDIPYKEAPKPQIVVQQPPSVVVEQPPSITFSASGASSGSWSHDEDDDDYDDHDDHDDD